MAVDKHTLKANALSNMRAAIAHEWCKFNLNIQLQKSEGVAKGMYKEAMDLIDIEFEHEILMCYKNLKELIEHG